MALKYFGYIFLSHGFSPIDNTVTTQNSQCKFKAVGIDFEQKSQAVDVAKSLLKEGAQMIELCGGFGPLWIAKISKAINYEIPVGSVAYGPEARQLLLDIIKPD